MQGLQTACHSEQGQVLSWYVLSTEINLVFHSSYLRLGCAYKKGLCSICGKQILDTTGYVMSSK